MNLFLALFLSVSQRKLFIYYIAGLGVTLSAIFCFLIYPQISDPLHVELDPDCYGCLGYGLWKYEALAYYPNPELTINRGPLYPAFIAFLLAISNNWYPYIIQVAQCILLGVICLMVYWMGARLFDKNVAALSAITCAIYPFLIWYTSRIWVEIVYTLLFTIIVACTVYLWMAPSIRRAVLLGASIGVAALCKSTTIPFVILIPICLTLLRDRTISVGKALLVGVCALIVIAPWSVRNWCLTGKLIPVHGLAGFNLMIGDEFASHWKEAPLSYRQLFRYGAARFSDMEKTLPDGIELWKKELMLEKATIEQSLRRYISDPVFLAKKMAVNMYMFWILGENTLKSIVIGLIQLPLLGLFVFSIIPLLCRNGLRTIYGLSLAIVISYFIIHLPIFAFARLSIVVIPTVIVYACANLRRKMERLTLAPLWGTCRLNAA